MPQKLPLHIRNRRPRLQKLMAKNAGLSLPKEIKAMAYDPITIEPIPADRAREIAAATKALALRAEAHARAHQPAAPRQPKDLGHALRMRKIMQQLAKRRKLKQLEARQSGNRKSSKQKPVRVPNLRQGRIVRHRGLDY